jgi:nicotinamidase-related amidase
MPADKADLYGSAPDKSDIALLLIDVINDLDFEGNEAICQVVPEMAKALAQLKQRAKTAGVPVLYVNDNFGKWQSDFRKLVDHCLHDDVPGRELVQVLEPDENDYFVLKPKHSGFHSTTLEILLHHLGTRTVVLAGIAGNICVLFTANDAYMRDFHIMVPRDCVISNSKEENDYALVQMEKVLKADIRPSSEINFSPLREEIPALKRPQKKKAA